jgi:WD40 repeat protein
MDRTGRVWDLKGNPVTPPLQHNSKVYHGIFNHNGQWVATASDDNTARVWDASTGDPITRPLPHRGSVVRAHFSVEDSLLVTASEDSSACVWDIHNGLPITPYLEHEFNVVDAVFVGDNLENLRIATASMDKIARLWVIPTDNRPVADLVKISQLLSGGKVDRESDFIRMDTEHLRQLWDEMHQLYPEGLILNPKTQ